MIQALRHIFKTRPETSPAAVPLGERVYAVGDVHGRLDLFAALARAIDADDTERGAAQTTVVLLGDLVDRGPASADVLDAAMAWQRRRKVRILAGNHEEMFLLSFYRPAAFRNFLRVGGRETILSYPVDPVAFKGADLDEAQLMMCAAVPQSHIDFLESLEDQIRIGDYLFVHAGIMPNLPLDEQRQEDLRWIREPFLTCPDDHGCVVVHGHTITEDAAFRHNRIGIDTGAFMSGRLTALGLEGNQRWLIEAKEDATGIATVARPA